MAEMKSSYIGFNPETEVGIPMVLDSKRLDALKAMELAERLRSEHNGIMSVILYMGHDGHNSCTLCNYEPIANETGRGESGVSLLDAVQKAASDWRFRLMVSEKTWAISNIYDSIREALKTDFLPDSVFSSQAFCNSINENSIGEITEDQAALILDKVLGVVRLTGTGRWFLLPNGMQRFLSPEPEEKPGESSG